MIVASPSAELTGHPKILSASAMTSRILHALPALATLSLFSCYPYPEPPPHHQRPGRDATVTDAEQQKIKDQRDRMKEAQERELQNPTAGGGPAADTTLPPRPENKKPTSVPTAQPVPGKEGFVFSPYNNKVIDVRDMPSGQLVADPTYPASEKKHFRVP